LPPEIAARLLPPDTKKPKEEGVVQQLSLVPEDLTTSEHAILQLLSADEPVQIDQLAESSKLSIPELTGALLGLEMRELIRQLPGKCFVRKL
jgi:DNA processing protein